MPTALTSARGRLAVAVRDGRREAEAEARADVAALRVNQAIRRDWAHLRPAQCAELARLLGVKVAVDAQR